MKDPDKFFHDIVTRVSEQSRCRSRNTGAVLVKDLHLIAEGWNSAPKGSDVKDCIKCNDKDAGVDICSGENQELNICVHAEANAIAAAAKFGIPTLGASLYTTTFPCAECAKLIISAGIWEIVYSEAYHSHYSELMFENANMIWRKFGEKHVRKPRK